MLSPHLAGRVAIQRLEAVVHAQHQGQADGDLGGGDGQDEDEHHLPVGLAMLVLARGGGEWHSAVLYTGINVLLVSQTLFFVQGLAVAQWLATTREFRPGSRFALFVAAILGQVLFQLTGLVGLLDTWLDYRRRFALKRPGTGSVR